VTPRRQSNRLFGPQLDSAILSVLPEILSDLRRDEFTLLYRGSRDGFQSSNFHSLCDGHSGTLTVVLSDNNSVFGGYTPSAWHSRGQYAPDPGLKSFLFRIQNPDGFPPRIFPQKQAEYAAYGGSGYGPIFGYAHDLYICADCNRSNCSSNVGTTYANDTGIAGTAELSRQGNRGFRSEAVNVVLQ
jgi:hypothetical protein